MTVERYTPLYKLNQKGVVIMIQINTKDMMCKYWEYKCAVERRTDETAIINARNAFLDSTDALMTVIREVEGNRVKERRLDPYLVCLYIYRVTTQLQGISKKDSEGVKAYIDPHAVTFSSAYRGIPESTQFTIIFKRGAWYITDIYRKKVSAATKGTFIVLTEAAKKAIIDKITCF